MAENNEYVFIFPKAGKRRPVHCLGGSMKQERNQRRDEKRERILDGAVRAFAAEGFHRTRVSEVARAAGVADGTIYLYFEGKDDLLKAIFDRAMGRFLERGLRVLAEAKDVREQIESFIRLHLQCVGEDRDLAVVFQIDLRRSPGFMRSLSDGMLGEYLEILQGMIERGQAKGLLDREPAARESAKMIFGVLDELSTDWLLSDRNYRLETKAPQAQRFVLRALGMNRDS